MLLCYNVQWAGAGCGQGAESDEVTPIIRSHGASIMAGDTSCSQGYQQSGGQSTQSQT